MHDDAHTEEATLRSETPGHNRRSFLARGGATILVGGGIAGLLAACGSDSSSDGTTAAETGDGDTGKVGPVVSIGSSEGDPANLDAGATNTFALLATVGSAAHAYLLQLEDNGSLGPQIATEHEVVSPKEVRFEIRDDVTFHNGRKLEAADVKKSYERLMDPKTASPYAPFLSDIKKITAKGTTVTFHLKKPYAPLLALTTQIPIIPIETASKQKTNPVGAGPFKFKRWQKDNFMEFERFPEYFDPSVPKVEGIRFLPRTDAAALRSGFQAKDEGVAVGFLWPDMKALQGGGGKTSTTWMNGFQFFAYNTTREPFDDPRVREALSIGMDRKRFAEAEFGAGAPVWPLPIDPKSPYSPPDPKIPYDVERAKELLDQAGVAGTTIEGLLVGIPLLRPLGPVWQDEYKKLGLTLKLQVLPPADVIDRVITRGDYQTSQFGDAAPTDPALFLDRYFKSDGPSNIMKYSNKKLDALLTEAAREFDEQKRKDLYARALEIIRTDNPVYQWSQLGVNLARQSTIGEFPVRPNYTFGWAQMTNSGGK